MSIISGGAGGSFSSGNTTEREVHEQQKVFNHSTAVHSDGSTPPSQPQPVKKRNLPGTPDPTAEVIALSPKTLVTKNRFVCEICKKGFPRDQNLQLHRRGHNLPWKLRQRTSTEIRKRVYVCPEPACIHHNPGRALGDLTGIKKHYCRKHCEKKWKCDKCSRKYAVQSDWKAHSKICGTKEYKCDCGTIFSRRDSFITHGAFCDALAEENNKVNQGSTMSANISMKTPDVKNPLNPVSHELISMPPKLLNIAGRMSSSDTSSLFDTPGNISSSSSCLQLSANSLSHLDGCKSKNSNQPASSAHTSATALLQKAAHMGGTTSGHMNSPRIVTSMAPLSFNKVLQHQSSSYNQTHIQNEFTSQFMQKGSQEESLAPQIFEASNAEKCSGLNNTLIYHGLYDRNHDFLKKIEENDNTNRESILVGNDSEPAIISVPTGRTYHQRGLSRYTGNGSNDTTTVDFLGIGGTRPTHFYEQHQQ